MTPPPSSSASGSTLARLPRRARRLLVALCAGFPLVGGGHPSPAGAQEAGEPACTEGPVQRIEVRNHSLFAPEDIRDHQFEWALGFANWVHVRTRDSYIRDELLFREGDCYRPETVRESARLIRDLDFIARVEAEGRRTADSTWVVHVETWDEWTTQLGIDVDVESDFQFKGFFVREKNVMGRGFQLFFRYRKFRERNDRNLGLATTRFLGTRANASVAAGTTRTGHFVRQEIAYPFVSESGRVSFASDVRWEDWEYSYLTGDHGSVSHVLLPLSDLRGHARFGRRFGEPGSLLHLGGDLELLHRESLDPPRQVVRGSFDDAVTAVDSLAGRLASQDEPDSHLRVGATVGFRRLRFTTARGLDRVTGEQNVALGSELMVTLGRSMTTFGTSSHFTWGRASGFASGGAGSLLANARFQAEGRLLDDAPGGGDRWRDLFLRGSAHLYLQPGSSRTHTFVTGIRGRHRAGVDQPWQMALGGEEGVRSYREDEVPTGSRLVAFAEHRVNLTWLAPAVDLGLTVFGDVGRGWAGDVPFGVDTGWRKAVGLGLRVGFPAGTGSVTRIELAWPVGGPDAGRSPVFRTYWAPALTSP